ncbi:MAG: hypothetical protein M5U07_13085 [Xanthobacteraceae bacterium]|nr:hypothetical protein [Xanthobacteraceae bacterium]
MSGPQHAEKKTGPERGGASSSAPKEALREEGPEKTAEESAEKSEKQRQDELLDKALMESFPGSDPVALTEPTKPEPEAPKKKAS